MPQTGEVLSNEVLQDSYHKIEFYVPEICKKTKPGQFVHIQIPNLKERILRRPFSICNVTEQGVLTVAYKVVGIGTQALADVQPGAVADVMGPFGVPFSIPADDEFPVIIGGGYGSAATYLLAQSAAQKGVLILGARSKDDLILVDKFEELGFEVLTTTNDGSHGHKGLVTDLIPHVIEKHGDKKLRFYGCGPKGMLMAMGKILNEDNHKTELSLDQMMCCGIGACFACVIKVVDDNEDGWRYARTCNEGPVFDSNNVYYE